MPSPGKTTMRMMIPLSLSRLERIPFGTNYDDASLASWFETRGVAARLTMRVQDLILRSALLRGSRRMKPPNRKMLIRKRMVRCHDRPSNLLLAKRLTFRSRPDGGLRCRVQGPPIAGRTDRCRRRSACPDSGDRQRAPEI